MAAAMAAAVSTMASTLAPAPPSSIYTSSTMSSNSNSGVAGNISPPLIAGLKQHEVVTTNHDNMSSVKSKVSIFFFSSRLRVLMARTCSSTTCPKSSRTPTSCRRSPRSATSSAPRSSSTSRQTCQSASVRRRSSSNYIEERNLWHRLWTTKSQLQLSDNAGLSPAFIDAVRTAVGYSLTH